MAHHLYVDVPGLRRAARQSLLAPSGSDWRVDIGRLCGLVAELTPPLHQVVLFGDGPGAGDSLAEVVRRTGLRARIVGPSVVRDDTRSLERDLLALRPRPGLPGRDAVTVVSGDEGLAAPIGKLRAEGVPVHLFFFVTTPPRLREAATTFRGLDGWLYAIVRPASPA
jgi:hypothetical protein